MANQKFSFEDFISTFDDEQSEFITKLHKMLIDGGCKIEVKESKITPLQSWCRRCNALAIGQMPPWSPSDSSAEMATLSGKFKEMASKVSQQHDDLLEKSSQMEMAAFTDPLTRWFQ